MTDRPAADVIEISFFGPGYGEAILIHFGNGDWIAIDSCIDPKNGNCVPLEYLMELEVDLANQLKLIIATHWHDDHIRGISSLFRNSTKAKFGLSAAFTKEEFLQWAAVNASPDPSPLGKTTIELMAVLQTLQDRGAKPIYVTPDRKLFSSKIGQSDAEGVLFSLSPSDAVIGRFLEQMASSLPNAGEPQLRAKDLKPNEVSVVLSAQFPNGSALLGADLEETPGKGWSNILATSTCIGDRATLFKVPHHGSENAHCDAVWSKMLSRAVIAIIAPWNRGKRLPTPSDAKRILSLTQNAYATADPNDISPIKRDPQVRRSLASMGIDLKLAQPRSGHLRFRRKIDESQWQIKMNGTAKHLRSIMSLPYAPSG